MDSNGESMDNGEYKRRATETIGSEFGLHSRRLEDDVVLLFVSSAKLTETGLLDR